MLDKMETYLNKLAPTALPKSTWGKAVTSARNQWEALRRYTEDGRLTPRNQTVVLIRGPFLFRLRDR